MCILEEDERREKKEEKTPISSSKALFRFSSPIGSFYRIGIACRKWYLRFFMCILHMYINTYIQNKLQDLIINCVVVIQL